MAIKVDQFVDKDKIDSFVCPRCGNKRGLDIVGGYYEKGCFIGLYRCHDDYRYDMCGYTVGVREPNPDIVWASPNGRWAVVMDDTIYDEARVYMTDGWLSWYAYITDSRDIYWDDMAEWRVPQYVRDAAASILYGEYDKNSKKIGRKKPIRYFVQAHRVSFPTFRSFADIDKADEYAIALYDEVKDIDRAFVQIGRFVDVYYDESEIPSDFRYNIALEYNQMDPPKKKAKKGKGLSILKRK